ncbi:MAG: hypothetical protein QXT53_08425 [Ignisphaera sp.]
MYLSRGMLLTSVSRALAIQYLNRLAELMGIPHSSVKSIDPDLLMVLSAVLIQLPLGTSAPLGYAIAYLFISQSWQLEKLLGTGEYILATPISRRCLVASKIVVGLVIGVLVCISSSMAILLFVEYIVIATLSTV